MEMKDLVNTSATTNTSNQLISKPVQFDNHPSSSSLSENPSPIQVPQLQQQVQQQQQTQSFFTGELNFSYYNGYDGSRCLMKVQRESTMVILNTVSLEMTLPGFVQSMTVKIWT
ncbi:hypothetical protein ACFX13_028253 [Malus domestica]